MPRALSDKEQVCGAFNHEHVRTFLSQTRSHQREGLLVPTVDEVVMVAGESLRKMRRRLVIADAVGIDEV